MAIRLEFIDLVVPVHLIEEKYPGGIAQCIADHQRQIGRRVWHDGQLFRDGGLDGKSVRQLVAGWQVLGFEPLQWVGGTLQWKDVCVVESATVGPTAPCDWIQVDRQARIAWLKGVKPGDVVGPGPRGG
jgi:hypothetical protein